MTEYPAGYTCEATVLRLDRYVVGSLPRADSLAVAEHLEACALCTERLVLLRLGSGTHASRGDA
ncbi:MAG: hypothetical protein ABR499_08190 [Gemmatimonadaceae bacterium]